MINVAKELLKGQEERKMELEKGFNVERVSLAEKLIAELKEALEVLGCGYLLEDVKEVKVDTSNLEAKLLKANNQIKALEEKCKEIGPLKAKVTKAVKAKEDKEKEIKELKSKITEANKEITKLKEIEKGAKDWSKELADKNAEIERLKQELNNKQTTNDNSTLIQALNAKDKYIIELESQLQDKAYNAANDGYVVDGVEVSVNIVKELNDRISELEEELAKNETQIETLRKSEQKYKKTAETLQSNYAKLKNEMNNAADKKEEDKVNKPVEEIVKVVPEIESSKEYFKLNTNAKFKNKTHLYESNDHFVIAKSNIKDIVIAPKKININVEESDFVKYENLLVNEFGFDKDRIKISPVTVEMKNERHVAFFTRTEAAESVHQFSYKDVYAGYVCCSFGKVYTWSWNMLTHEEPCVIDLSQKARGKSGDVYGKDRKSIVEIVKSMYKVYDEKVKAYCETNNVYNMTEEYAEEMSNQCDERLAELFNYQKETEEIASSAVKPQTIVENNNKEVHDKEGKDMSSKPQSNLSASMDSFVQDMF